MSSCMPPSVVGYENNSYLNLLHNICSVPGVMIHHQPSAIYFHYI